MTEGKRQRRATWVEAAALGICAQMLTSGGAHAQAADDQPAPAGAAADTESGSDPAQQAIVLIGQDADEADVFKFDFGVPSSPALTLLGVDKDKITQANSLKPFVLALPGLLSGKDGAQSIAVEVSPAGVFTDSSADTYSNYSALQSVLFRTRIGGALYRGVDDTDPAKQKASRASIGVSTSLLGASDPLRATFPGWHQPVWQGCVHDNDARILGPAPHYQRTPEMQTLFLKEKALERANRSNPSPELEAEIARIRQTLEDAHTAWVVQMVAGYKKSDGPKVIETCMKVASRAAQMASDLDLGGGAVWSGDPGKLSGFKNPTAVFWGSFRTSILAKKPDSTNYLNLQKWLADDSPWLMIGASGRIGLSEAIATGDGTRPEIRANTFTGWAGLERYKNTSRFAAQLGFQKTSPKSAADSVFGGTRLVYQVSFDQKVTKTVWLSLNYGKANGTGALKDDSTLRLSVVFDTPAVRKIFGN